MIRTFDISTSGLVAQRVRLNAISSNLANMSTLVNENGEAEPYKARFPVFETNDEIATPYGASGVKVASIEVEQSEPRYKYQPNHPLAIKEGKYKGYVAYPNINMINEFTDALEATRAYEANIGVIEATKSMGNQALRIVG